MKNLVRKAMLEEISYELLNVMVPEEVLKDEYPDDIVSFDILNNPKARGLKAVIKHTLAEVRVDGDVVLKYSPYKIVSYYKGVITDVVLQDADGDYLMIPSGVLHALHLAETEGIMPPVMLGDEPEKKTASQSFDELMESLKRAS